MLEIMFFEHRLAAVDHVRVSRHISGIAVREGLGGVPFAQRLRSYPGVVHNRRIWVNVAKVNRTAGIVTYEFAHGKPFAHFLEQGPVLLLAVAQRRFYPRALDRRPRALGGLFDQCDTLGGPLPQL